MQTQGVIMAQNSTVVRTNVLSDHLAKRYALLRGLNPRRPETHEEMIGYFFQLLPVDERGQIILNHPDTQEILGYVGSLRERASRIPYNIRVGD
jgi:hypothetical protein